jgi:monoamine oxidase
MNREEFLKMSALMGIGLTLMPSLVTSCSKEEELNVTFNGKVIIIGAGAAGMMAAYTLQQHGIDFQLIEASAVFGGRVAKLEGFADFPIDLGAEWLHTNPKVFGQMIDDPSVDGSVDLISYQPESVSNWNNGTLHQQNWGSHFYGEYKFKKSTWFDFFEDYIVPSISSKMILDAPVIDIDYSGSQVSEQTSDLSIYAGDKVLVTVPTKILQSSSINFNPALSAARIAAINSINIPPGIKVYIEFQEKFYPDITLMGPLLNSDSSNKLYFDGAFKKDSATNLMTLFYVSDTANDLTDLSDADVFIAVMEELDEIFEGQASQHYIKHHVQNWSAMPYIQGAYTYGASNHQTTINTITAPLADKVYFAGESLQKEDWATVHGAGLSGQEVAKNILTGG